MKKRVATLLTAFSYAPAFCLPLANPTDASLLTQGIFTDTSCKSPSFGWLQSVGFRLGFYGDYVFNRHLKFNENQSGFGANESVVEKTELFTNAGFLALNFCNRVDFFTTLGASRLRLDTPITTVGMRYHVETSTHFSWSVGCRATLWDHGCTSVGLEGQYFQFNPTVERFSITDATSFYLDSPAAYREWQVGLGLSHRVRVLVPYLGVKYARSQFNYTDDADERSYRSDKHWGAVIGTTLAICKRASVTAEGRFGDEKALHVNGQIRF